jgi:hypothetical protein
MNIDNPVARQIFARDLVKKSAPRDDLADPRDTSRSLTAASSAAHQCGFVSRSETRRRPSGIWR